MKFMRREDYLCQQAERVRAIGLCPIGYAQDDGFRYRLFRALRQAGSFLPFYFAGTRDRLTNFLVEPEFRRLS